MRIIFFGTFGPPAFSRALLDALLAEPEIEVVTVVIQPEKSTGRKKADPLPDLGIPILQPTKLKDEATLQLLRSFAADVFVVVAYGRIIPPAILNLPPFGCVNVHPSLLPKYRGPSPIVSAIANGETETGVTIMKLDAEMDHGPILTQRSIPITANDTAESMSDKVVSVGAPLLIETLKGYADGKITPQEQDHSQATLCAMIKREDGGINWTESAEIIERKIRAYIGWPGTWTTFEVDREKRQLKIFSAKISEGVLEPAVVAIEGDRLFVGTGSRALQILEVQPGTGKRMPASAFINGLGRKINGLRLGD